MLRKITKDVGRYEANGQHDYPNGVWQKIALDLQKDPRNKELFKGTKPGDAESALKAFSEPVDVNHSLQSATRGVVIAKQRAGSPARPATRARN
jgi:hypothetical protein